MTVDFLLFRAIISTLRRSPAVFPYFFQSGLNLVSLNLRSLMYLAPKLSAPLAAPETTSVSSLPNCNNTL